jgi:anion-transporting  ArsA/GET3 family ATPase
MLDPQVVADSVVKRFSKDEKEAAQLLDNRIYRNVTAMVAGMQEYTAVQAMHDFISNERYDLIVLDTPPSRNALHFLEAPGRITRFLDGRVFRFFMPSGHSLLKRATTKVVDLVLDTVFGHESREELMAFFALFSSILDRLNHNASETRAFFQRSDVAFLVVTSPAQEALEEALYFEKKTRDELSLPLSGYLMNRSLASYGHKRFPDPTFFNGRGISEETQAKVRALAEGEQQLIARHQEQLATIRSRLRSDEFVETLPYLGEGVHDIASLVALFHAYEAVNSPSTP